MPNGATKMGHPTAGPQPRREGDYQSVWRDPGPVLVGVVDASSLSGAWPRTTVDEEQQQEQEQEEEGSRRAAYRAGSYLCSLEAHTHDPGTLLRYGRRLSTTGNAPRPRYASQVGGPHQRAHKLPPPPPPLHPQSRRRRKRRSGRWLPRPYSAPAGRRSRPTWP